MANIGIDILGLPTTVGGLTGDEWVPLVQGGTTKRTQSVNLALGTITEFFPAGLDYVMFGGSGVIPTGVIGTGLVVPFNATISQALVNGNALAGSIVVDIWKCTESQYDGGTSHPVVGDSITGGNPLTISAASKAESDLVGWTISLSQGDILWYNVQSISGFTSVTVALKLTRLIP